jgi:porin
LKFHYFLGFQHHGFRRNFASPKQKVMKKRYVLLCSTLLSTVFLCFAGEDPSESPFNFGASYVGEGLRVLKGGIRQGGSYEGMANLNLAFDTEKAGWWKGGSFLVTGANTHGASPSADLIGDFQIASNIEAGNLTYLHECWFRQELGRWTFIGGLQDLNVEFVSTEGGSLFLNSSFGVHSTIASNVPSPIFPLTSIGAQIQCRVSKACTIKLAAFDGMPEDMDYNPHNVSWDWDSDDGYLAFAELDLAPAWLGEDQGQYRVGGYYHNHSKESDIDDPVLSNYGIYLTGDQKLVETSSGKTLSAFVQFSISPASMNDNNWYAGGGINQTGLFPGRNEDVFGLALCRAGLQNSVNGSETVLEMTYKLKINDCLFLQPDLQYIVHPAGTNVALDNALAGILRFGFEFNK